MRKVFALLLACALLAALALTPQPAVPLAQATDFDGGYASYSYYDGGPMTEAANPQWNQTDILRSPVKLSVSTPLPVWQPTQLDAPRDYLAAAEARFAAALQRQTGETYFGRDWEVREEGGNYHYGVHLYYPGLEALVHVGNTRGAVQVEHMLDLNYVVLSKDNVVYPDGGYLDFHATLPLDATTEQLTEAAQPVLDFYSRAFGKDFVVQSDESCTLYLSKEHSRKIRNLYAYEKPADPGAALHNAYFDYICLRFMEERDGNLHLDVIRYRHWLLESADCGALQPIPLQQAETALQSGSCMTENCPVCTENAPQDWSSYDAVELVYYGRFAFRAQTPMYAFYQYLPDGGYAAAYVPAVPLTGDTPVRHVAAYDHW